MSLGGKGYFQNPGGSWLKGGIKKFGEVSTMDEAMVCNSIWLESCCKKMSMFIPIISFFDTLNFMASDIN